LSAEVVWRAVADEWVLIHLSIDIDSLTNTLFTRHDTICYCNSVVSTCTKRDRLVISAYTLVKEDTVLTLFTAVLGEDVTLTETDTYILDSEQEGTCLVLSTHVEVVIITEGSALVGLILI
jgi:hypothetical protein